MFAEPTALRPLVAEELRGGEPPDWLAEGVGTGADHPGEGRGHLRPERDLPSPLVDEVVELADDLVPALAGVEVEGLERGAVVFDEGVPARDGPPGLEDMGAAGQLVGIEITESG